MKHKILVVDDEEHILEMMQEMLEREGYEVLLARDGREGIRTFFNAHPSLVMTDIRMPGMDGWTLLERIREVSEVPVIVLTALDREPDAVRGLKSGANDYVAKPARLNEFLCRVETLLKKAQPSPEVRDEYSDGALHIDFTRHMVFLKGEQIDLTPQEFRLLSALVRNAGMVVSTDRLLDVCWAEIGGPEHVRVYIGYLRKKLEEDPSKPRLIQTVREFGYRYCPPEQLRAFSN